MEKTTIHTYAGKFVATFSLLLVVGLSGGTASATFMPGGSSAPQVGEGGSFDHAEKYDFSGRGSEGDSDDHQHHPSAVPEAGTLVLLGAGFFALAVYSKRHRAKVELA
jgi:hypothetical protein